MTYSRSFKAIFSAKVGGSSSHRQEATRTAKRARSFSRPCELRGKMHALHGFWIKSVSKIIGGRAALNLISVEVDAPTALASAFHPILPLQRR